MDKLSSFEMVSIKRGIEIEFQYDFRIHKQVKNETFNLFMKYSEMIAAIGNYDELDIETTVKALHKLADFWTNYYLYGEVAAREKFNVIQ